MTKCCLTDLRGPGVVVALEPRSELAHDAQGAEAGNGTLRGDQEHAVLCGRHLRARFRVNEWHNRVKEDLLQSGASGQSQGLEDNVL